MGGFALFPMVVLTLFLAWTVGTQQLADALPGAGPAAQLDIAAHITAQQAEVFTSAFVSSAIASPGLVSASLVVQLPPGVSVPKNALCMTTANGAGRNIYGYLPTVPGMVGQIISDTQGNAMYYRVTSIGVGSNLVTNAVIALPTAIPVGNVVMWSQASS